jgi:hypothetical protein
MQFSNFLKCGWCVDGSWMVCGCQTRRKAENFSPVDSKLMLCGLCVDSMWMLRGCKYKGHCSVKAQGPKHHENLISIGRL